MATMVLSVMFALVRSTAVHSMKMFLMSGLIREWCPLMSGGRERTVPWRRRRRGGGGTGMSMERPLHAGSRPHTSASCNTGKTGDWSMMRTYWRILLSPL